MERVRRYIIGIVVLLGLIVHLPLMAGNLSNHSVPTTPEPHSAQQTLSMPMAAPLVLDRVDVSCPVAQTSSLNRSRRTVSQWTQPSSITGVACFANLLTNYIKDRLLIADGLSVNFPSEHISFPFHVFW